MTRLFPIIACLAAAACSQQSTPPSNGEAATPSENDAASAPSAIPVGNVAVVPSKEATTTTPPKTSLPEPQGPIDPKSTEAAGQVVQHYGALIEQGRLAEAARYWGSAASSAAFADQLKTRGLKHLEIGDLGTPEGAAGSIYVTMPVVFYSDAKRQSADVILRRVNDVPGSTAEQRRWHIERVEWKA